MEVEYAPLILIVDDLITNIQLLAHALEGEYRVKFATNGQTALALANADEKPDLILLDVMMPDIDGYEVCRLLHETPEVCDIPVIFVTAKHEPLDQSKGFASGGVDYITKPFDLPIVRARVRTHIKIKLHKEHMEKISSLDELTGIPNRRQLNNILKSEWQRAIRNRAELSLLMIDVDHFKKFNDHYGHIAGDECLINVAKALQKACYRPGDFVARYGGEEFTVILPESNRAGAQHLAERLRAAVEALNISHKNSEVSHHVTISIGGASVLPSLGQNHDILVLAADNALYQAKNTGRNRVVITGDPRNTGSEEDPHVDSHI
jgi:diguanylate cyclase (GGDEF)-like protein